VDVVLIYWSSAVFPSKCLRPAPQASVALNFYFSRPSLFSNGQGMEWDLSEGYSPSRDHLSGFSLHIPFLFPILFFFFFQLTLERLSCLFSPNIVVVPSLSHVWLFVTPWTAECQASLSVTISWSLFKFMSLESVMLSNHLILPTYLDFKFGSNFCSRGSFFKRIPWLILAHFVILALCTPLNFKYM